MKPRLFFDVTQLVHWPGRLTGIPRVMYEMATRFDEDDETDCVFVTWVRDLKQFCEVDLKSTLSQRGRGIAYIKTGSTSTNSVPVTKLNLKRVVKAGFNRAGRINPRLSNALEQRIRLSQSKTYKKVTFQAADQLIIPWGEWSDEIFISQLQLWQKQGLQLIQVIHDLGPILAPQFANAGNAAVTFPEYLRAILPICSLVLAVSEHTKKTILTWLEDNHLPVASIKVFREGDDFHFANAIKPTNKQFQNSGLNGNDFILMVGTLEPKKNHMLLYYVYKLASSLRLELPKLVIVGRPGWRSDDTLAIMSEDPEVKDNFIWLFDASDEELSWLYDHCLFTIFASFFEGWGIPVAESLSRGVPVLASNATSIPEVAGNFAEYFSPADSEECLSKIRALLKPNRLALARAKVKQYKLTPWDKSFNQIRVCLREIA